MHHITRPNELLAAAPAPQLPKGWPLWRLGFRPFYLGAAGFAALAVPLWLLLLHGSLGWHRQPAPMLWHAHEMLYGFAVAVIVGFLLTAGRAWTGLATPRGPLLAGLFGLWLAARLAMLLAPYPLAAAIDLLLLPLVAALLASVLLRAGNRRNLPLPLILLGLALSNAVFHGAVLGLIDADPQRALHAALALVVMLECVISGRVVPAFTASATPGLKLKAKPRQEAALLALSALALAWWVFAAPGPIGALLLAATALGHGLRQWRWQPWRTLGRPILWILHAACAWLVIGFALLSMAQLGWITASAGLHALAVGATGGLIIGMLTRTARGHTGRPLKASTAEVLAYALVMAAALLRVFVPMLAPAWSQAALIAAAAAWSLAFGIYLVVFTPWLLRTRLDGKDG